MTDLYLFDMGFLNPQSWGGGGHNFFVIALIIMKFGTGIDILHNGNKKACDVTAITS